jgi:hypothetical protein
MNKWWMRGLTAVGAGVVGTFLVMSEGRRRRSVAAEKEAQKSTKWKKGTKKGEPESSWADRVKQAGENVKKNVGEQVNNPNIQDRLRNLSSWVEGPGSPGYERESEDEEITDETQDSANLEEN